MNMQPSRQSEIHMARTTIAPWADVVTTARFPMDAGELARLPDDGFQYELVEGRLVRMPPPKPRHGLIASHLDRVLGTYVETHHLGKVFTADTGFLLSRRGERHTVLGADVAFVRAGRLPPPDSPEWDEYFRLAPDLSVEVASPSQYRPELTAKAQQWVAAGTRLVWVVWPPSSSVDVWRAGRGAEAAVATLREDDLLDGLDVVPGFTYPVADLFSLL